MRNPILDIRQTFGEMTLAEKAGLLLLLALVLVAPLSSGGILPGGALRIQLLCFASAAVALVANRTVVSLPRFSVIALMGIAVVGLFQILPLSQQVVAGLSPSSSGIYAEANQILQMFNAGSVTPRISIAPARTVTAILFVLSYVSAFVAGVLIIRSRAQRSIVVGVLLCNCVVHVLYAARFQSDQERIHSTFANPNHFSGYLELGLPFAFALLWIEITRRRSSGKEEDRGDVLEKRIIGLAWRVMLWSAIAVGIGFTRSRMGIAAAAVATLMMLTLATIKSPAGQRKKRHFATAVVVLSLGLAAATATTGEVPLVRFLAADPRDPDSDVRTQLWRGALKAWSNFPHFGSGLGSFPEAFLRIQSHDLGMTVEQAHNDTLQLLVTGGWISVLLAVVGIGWLIFRLTRLWWYQLRSREAVIALASLGSLCSILIHGLVDFNFSIPAIPTTLAIVLAIGWSAANAPPYERNGTGTRRKTL